MTTSTTIEQDTDREFWVTSELADPGDQFWSDRFLEVASAVEYKPNFGLRLAKDQKGDGRWFFQVQAWQRDFQTGEYKLWNGGKSYLSPHAGTSELVQTVFGLFKGFEEHECREMFRWNGRRVFGPHIDVTYLSLRTAQTEPTEAQVATAVAELRQRFGASNGTHTWIEYQGDPHFIVRAVLKAAFTAGQEANAAQLEAARHAGWKAARAEVRMIPSWYNSDTKQGGFDLQHGEVASEEGAWMEVMRVLNANPFTAGQEDWK